MKNKLQQKLALILPGIFLLGFNIGTGSVTTMAKTGADYGMALLWTLVASCIATYYMILSYSRYTLVTGETALQAFRKHIHPALGIFFIVALTSGVAGSVMGVMGIVADISSVWSETFIDGGIAPVYFAAFFIAIVYFIFWNGETQFFERALAVMVAIMAGCFLVNFFILTPPLGDIMAGLIPSVPDVPEGEDKSPYIIMASMVGTTVSSALFIVRTTLVKEAGWTIGDWTIQRRDAIISVVLMFVISMSIMAAAAGTLFPAGLVLNEASQMITLLEPLAGSLAVGIFAFGIIAAGVSSQFPNVLLLPWLLCDYNQSPRNMKLGKYRLMVLAISLLGLIVPIFNARPVFVMIISQALNSIILPLTVGCILYLGNKESLMGKHKLSLLMNIVLILVFVFALFTTYLSIRGIMASF
ncbi:Nramp family divalent metal transporter [Saprospiraceae bacterium]|nr:Nramp family divalent metal transporter [Saprospiraceae bacterium]